MSRLETLPVADRAALELLVRHKKGYQALASQLQIEATVVRKRANAAGRSLVQTELPEDDTGAILDYLLGEADNICGRRARALIERTPAAADWATAISKEIERLEQVLPTVAVPQRRKDQPRKSFTLNKRVATGISCGLLLIVGGFVLANNVGGDKKSKPAPTPTSPPIDVTKPQKVGSVSLTHEPNETGRAAMNLFLIRDQLAFTIKGRGLKPNGPSDSYVIWIAGRDKITRLGFVQTAVGKSGKLAITGPEPAQLEKFPKLIANSREIILTRETSRDPKEPSQIVLRGNLPRGANK